MHNLLKYSHLLIFSLIVILFSCEDEYFLQLTEGISTIHSFEPSNPMGFSFETSDTMQYPNKNDLFPDFTITSLGFCGINEINTCIQSPYKPLVSSIYLIREFVDEKSASDYFNTVQSLNIEDYGAYYSQSTEVRSNQVWIIETKINNYGLLLIKSITSKFLEDNLYCKSFSQMTFQWKYQPNGTATF